MISKAKIISYTIFFSFFVITTNINALNIQYTPIGDIIKDTAIEMAIQSWEDKFIDPITVDIDFSFVSLAPNVIGATSSSFDSKPYTEIKNRLNLDKKSTDDMDAVNYINNLPMNGNNLLFYSNSNYPNPSGSTDLWQSPSLVASTANLKALGYTYFGNDASISFNSNFAFDYDPTDGITAGFMDFVGIAMHELGHALGFISIVDVAAANHTVYTPYVLDLYRHTAQFGNSIIDASYDGRDAYFSHDLGLTTIDFSDGKYSSDGRQASHWADGLGLGLMDPTAGWGESLSIHTNDLLAFDVIGWDLRPIPEPASLFLLASGLMGLIGIKKK